MRLQMSKNFHHNVLLYLCEREKEEYYLQLLLLLFQDQKKLIVLYKHLCLLHLTKMFRCIHKTQQHKLLSNRLQKLQLFVFQIQIVVLQKLVNHFVQTKKNHCILLFELC